MKDLPDGWAVEPFSKVARYETGRTPARANPAYWEKDDNQVPWVAISDMDEYGRITATAESISSLAFRDVFRGRIVPAGTLLMSFKLTIGRVATLGLPACHNEAIISIYPRKGVDQRYLGYFLSQVDYADHQDRQIKGNTLNQSKIDQIQIALPPSDQQTRIADVLDHCRLAVNTERAAETKARELKRAAMRDLFSRGLRGEGQKESDIGLLPNSWFVERLDARAQVVSTRMSYAELETARAATESAVRVLGIKVSDMNRTGNETVLASAALEKMLDAGQAKYRCAPPGTIVFPKRGAAIATNKKRLTSAWSVFDPNVIGVVPGDAIDPGFLFQWFQSFDLKTITEPGPTPQLNKKHLEPLLIPVPPDLAEQQDIAALFDALDRKIDLHRKRRAVLEELFQSLLHKLMTGEIAVSDLDLSALYPASTRPEEATA